MELPSALLLSPHNAGPVGARWRRAADLADRGEPATHEWDDGWVRRGLDYLNRLRACRDDGQRRHLAREAADIAAAHRLHMTADKLARGTLEARLLAGQTIEETAAACGLSAGAVEAYHELFFHVRGSLGAKGYIFSQAIGGKVWYGLTEDDVDVLLKQYAYLKGPFYLEAMLLYFRGEWSVPERLESASREQLERLAIALGIRAVVKVRVLPFPECLRVQRLMSLVKELWGYIDTLPGAAWNGGKGSAPAGWDQSGLRLDAAPGSGEQVPTPGGDPAA